MAVSFPDLVSPLSQPDWVQFLLTSLQGISPVVQTPANGTNQLLGTGTISVNGPAQASDDVVIMITTSGDAAASGSAYFQYSLDGGTTYQPSSPIQISANNFAYALPTVAVQIVFENGSYQTAGSDESYFVQGETYSFTCSTPTFPVTNWPAIGVGNSLVQVDAAALADLNILMAQAIAGGFTQSWISPPLVNGVPTPPPGGWLDLLASNFYNLQRGQPLQTQGNVVLTAAATAGPYTIIPGQLFAATANGQYIFTNVTGGTLGVGMSLILTFQALTAGAAYNQVQSSGQGASGLWLTSLLTPLAGVTITNPLQSSGAFTQAGPGAGTIIASGAAVGQYSILVKVLNGGTAGGATGSISYSTAGGANQIGPITPIPTSLVLGATGITATLSGTFDTSAVYAFSTSWITQQGVDAQSDLSLAVACQNQWASLAPASPTGIYLNWAMAASPEVVNALVIADPITPGQVDITLIGGPPTFAVSAGAITAVQNYIAPRAPLGISVSVGSVTTLSVQVAAAYIVVRTAYQSTIATSIQQSLNAYGETILPQGVVELSEVAALIQSLPGVIEINPLSSLTLNGVAADLAVPANNVPSLLAPPASSFKFV